MIFAAIFNGHHASSTGSPIELTTYYVPGIMTLGIISASFVNLTLAIVAAARERACSSAPARRPFRPGR